VKIILVGPAHARDRLRDALAGSAIEIVGEAASLAEARQLDADAVLMDAGRPRRAGEDAPESLTPREVQVLELLAEGLPNKAIAARLDISDQTVKFHVSSICGKLGAANRTEAVRIGLRRGLITL